MNAKQYRWCAMSDDPKDFFTKPRAGFAERVDPERTAEATTAYDVGSAEYKAYGVMPGGSAGCDVRSWKAMRMDVREGVMFDYRLLMAIGYAEYDSGEARLEVSLMFPDFVIRLVGRNLEDLRLKISLRQVSFVQQYSPMVHKVALDRLPPDEPVIEQIHFMRGSDPFAGMVGGANGRPN